MNHLQLAMDLAAKHHAGQQDKSGAPYVEHLRRVAERLVSDDQRVVAWLHDIIEDTPMTAADLAAAGFPDLIVEGVVALTRRDGETYDDFIRRAAAHPLARQVKLADLSDNMDEERVRLLSTDQLERLRTKYSAACSPSRPATPSPRAALKTGALDGQARVVL